jgi:hypothetical protein
MSPSTWLSRGWVLAVLTGTLLSGGCRQTMTRSDSPTPLQGPASAPAASPQIPGPPAEVHNIPAVPPSTAARPSLEGPFGFTAPKLSEPEPRPNDRGELDSLLGELDFNDVLPVASEEADEIAAAAELEMALPLFATLKPRETAPVELDASLFLLELLEADLDAELDIELPAKLDISGGVSEVDFPAQPQPVAEVVAPQIQPWTPPPPAHEPRQSNTPPFTISAWTPPPPAHEPRQLQADGPRLPSILPGPVSPQWIGTTPVPTRPRRLAVKNSDSDLRPIE